MDDPKKKNRAGLWVGLTLVAVIGVVGIASTTPAPTTSEPAAAVESVNQQIVAPAPATNPAPSTLSNNNYYTNVDGNAVHSPADSSDGCVAAGATAECNDGTCSFSQHHSGTCSHHGGVASWLN
jgi:hypothetical protein